MVTSGLGLLPPGPDEYVMSIDTKICGVTTADCVAACIAFGAQFIGFVFFARSPRAIDSRRAAELAALVPAGVGKVGLVVDADDNELTAICAAVPLDALQLHGRETPQRVREIRTRFGLPIFKAIGIIDKSDVDKARSYEEVADRLLFDAKPPERAMRPGGNARSFNWSLLAGKAWRVPWFVAGGVTIDNVAEALRLSGARGVDVSSGVEMNGRKDVVLIRAFLTRVRAIGTM
jgi:phosphoribosylanthranilate isomerase